MVRPQRGQSPLLLAQVVPQLEHWATPPLPLPLGAGGQVYMVPFAPLAEVPSTGSKAQEDWGNKGREKNSSGSTCYLHLGKFSFSLYTRGWRVIFR